VDRHHIAPTTHTPELTQIAELNGCLQDDAAPPDAADLGLAGARAGGKVLRPGAVLRHLTAVGPPDFPYIDGRFYDGSRALSVPLHTRHLEALSRRYRRHHRWGA
jgi:hypothetical protein